MTILSKIKDVLRFPTKIETRRNTTEEKAVETAACDARHRFYQTQESVIDTAARVIKKFNGRH